MCWRIYDTLIFLFQIEQLDYTLYARKVHFEITVHSAHVLGANHKSACRDQHERR
jgi:hypothetical protein